MRPRVGRSIVGSGALQVFIKRSCVFLVIVVPPRCEPLREHHAFYDHLQLTRSKL